MEAKESRNNEAKGAGKNIRSEDVIGDDYVHSSGICKVVGPGIIVFEEIIDERVSCKADCTRGKRCMKQHVQEELIVVKADTIGYPRTMVVHFQDAPITL